MFLIYENRPYFEKAAQSRKANGKLQKLFAFVKMAEHDGVAINLN